MTAKDVYEAALAKLDEIEKNGTINTTRTAIYAGKAPRLIDALHRDIGFYEGAIITKKITSLDDELQISDDSAMRIMPYGLAAEFALADQNASVHNTNLLEYERRLRTIHKSEKKIVDKYNILAGMQ